MLTIFGSEFEFLKPVLGIWMRNFRSLLTVDWVYPLVFRWNNTSELLNWNKSFRHMDAILKPHKFSRVRY
jgi:hypothetical protein